MVPPVAVIARVPVVAVPLTCISIALRLENAVVPVEVLKSKPIPMVNIEVVDDCQNADELLLLVAVILIRFG